MVTSISTRNAERWCCFVTTACADSRATLLTRHIHALGAAVREVQRAYRFRIEAFVVLPDHLHAICSAPHPADAAAFCRATIAVFARRLARESHETREALRHLRWDCARLRPERLRHLVDCIHLDPVRHGLVTRAAFWPWSSFSRYARGGVYGVKRGGVREEGVAFGVYSQCRNPKAAAERLLAAETVMCDDAPRGSGGSGCASARWGIAALSANSALALLWGFFCVAFAHAEAAADSRAHAIEIVAIAADVHAIVVRNAAGQLARYDEGAVVAGSAWHVLRVTGERAVLVYAQRLRGSVVEMAVRSGDRIDLDASTAQLVEARQPYAIPARSDVRAARRNAAPVR
jgi:putative transposase